ncbi:MAG: 2-oxo acid dehydrogenase subunit E2 [Anaerolineales bacterium]|nr:2-oxo acid dehydrogenase subunit E2 [Anaerolineales bacterium]
MPTKVTLPEMGEGVTDATITAWMKQEGEQVRQYEPLVEVNTDKVDTEIPSPVDGTVLKILHPADTVVAVDEILCWIGEPGEEIPDADLLPVPEKEIPAPKPDASLPIPAPKPAPKPQIEAPLPENRGDYLAGAVSPVAARTAAQLGVDLSTITGSGLGGMVTKTDVLAHFQPGAPLNRPVVGKTIDPRSTFISPVVSRLAVEHGIDLAAVKGTGLYGQITKYDILREIEGGQTAGSSKVRPHPAYSGHQPGTLLKHTPVRRSIARNMLESKQTSPHVSTFIEADLSAVSTHREANKAAYAGQGAKLTFTAYFVLAAAAALKAYPIVNSSWSDEGILLHPEINIGMAVSLDADGLIVPVIQNAGELSLFQAAQAVNDLAARARNKQLSPEEVRGGTFTITNHGTSGSLFATPIINQPQCAILGTGAIQKRAVVINDAITIRPMVYLNLTFDHRILDGAVADYFLNAVREGLEKAAF